ncbi:unnamed protein product [Cylindrotheca closterium]|uniref:Uncharacterized protein n=1 Tax=Cylindrotheca closterium TaxID=2856 RepID=A0AAD2JHX3_9STRA|nr:unnamed protein product [Cylindrotheca closterium]
MPRRSRSKAARRSNQEQIEANENGNEAGRSVASHVRDRQRAVAEREAARLARPEQRKRVKLAHADRKKSAVTSTPFGLHRGSSTVDDEPEDQEWCGPFSVARQVLRQREEAKRKAEEEENNAVMHPLDDLMNQVGQEQKKKAHPSLTWKGDAKGTTPSSLYAKRQMRMEARQTKTIPTLFQLCVDFLVDNFEHVESLGDVDNDCRLAISKELVKRNQLNAKAFESLVSSDMDCLEIIDCAGIPQDVMAKVLTGLHSLSFLMLTHAGRCFGPKSVDVLLETKPPLCCLSIAGAYLLKDEHAASLIQVSASTLQSISFDTCPLLGEKFIRAIEKTDGTLLEISLKNLSLSSDTLKILATCKDAMRNVRSLTYESMPGITDAVLGELLQVVADSLESLDVSHNYDLTDASLSAIRQFNIGLRSLTMNGVKELTSLGLETFFTYDLEGLPSPPKLKVLKLASCDHEAVTDEVLKLATANSSTQNKESMGPRGGGLVQLDIEGSTLVTDSTLEHLVEGSSANTLTEMNLSYCPHITDQGLGYFVSKCGSQLSKIQVWGCAQLSDEFFDGHDRVNDASFELVGAWMKRSGTRSLR